MNSQIRRVTVVACLAFASLGTVAYAQTPAQDKMQKVMDKGLEFLKSHQSPDGSWQSGPRDLPGVSGLVLRAFVMDPRYNADTDFVKKGFERFIAQQQPDGGIYNGSVANYNTAIGVSTLAAANKAEYKPNIDKALAFLKGKQWNDSDSGADAPPAEGNNSFYGGWGYANQGQGKGRPDLSNSQMVIDALHDAGIPKDDPAYKAAVKFLSRIQNRSETNDLAWAGNDGGFIYSLGPNGQGQSSAGAFTTADGKPQLRSYGSMTYAGLKSFIFAGLSKDDARVKAAFDWITKNWTLDENPGMRTSNPGEAQAGLFYYYHTLARALNEYDQPVITDPQGKKHDWRVELIDKLAAVQKEDGSYLGDARWMENNPTLATAFAVLALQEVQKDLKEHPIAP